MLVLTSIRKLYKILSADSSPDAIAFATAFGLLAGLIPLGSALLLVVIAFILIFRVQVSTAIAFFGVGLLLRLALSPLCLEIGTWLLEAESLKGFWTAVITAPVLAWFGLEHYYTVGSIVVGLALGAIAYPLMRYAVVAYRRWAHEKVSKNKFFKWLTSFWFTKGIKWIFVG